MATTSASTRRPAAFESGVRTVVARVGRSRVASASRNVIAFRASARNSSGTVARSRSPARQSWTTGCALTCSGTVPFDQPAHGIHGHGQEPVHVRGLEMLDLAGPHLVGAHQD